MDSQRAREILSSPNMINVTYNGSEVYLEQINETNATAEVHYLNEPKSRFEVPLNSLEER